MPPQSGVGLTHSTLMPTISVAVTRSIAAVGLVVGLVIVGVACTADTAPRDAESTVTVIVVPQQSAPAERLTPFCQEMSDISARLETDPPGDIGAFVLERYRTIADFVPAEIAVDFAAVVAELEGGPSSGPEVVPTTVAELAQAPPDLTTGVSAAEPEGDAFFEEGYEPGDTPAARLNSYVAFACRDTANNPGPPATQPFSEPATTAP